MSTYSRRANIGPDAATPAGSAATVPYWRERRAHRRYEVSLSCHVCVQGVTYEGQTVNVSPSGALLALEAPLRVPSVCLVTLHGASGSLALPARVVRTEPGNVAIRFEPFDGAIDARFHALLREATP